MLDPDRRRLCAHCDALTSDPEGFCPRCGDALLDPEEPAVRELILALDAVRDRARLQARARLAGLGLAGLGALAAAAAALTGSSGLWMMAIWGVLSACFLLDTLLQQDG